jgi:predicted nucleotidyltransferase
MYPIEVVVLYGSYARGWQQEWSDIDLAVISTKFDKISAPTWRKVREIAHAVSPLLDARPFGRNEFKNYERGDFVHEIHRTGLPIYVRKRFRFPTHLS